MVTPQRRESWESCQLRMGRVIIPVSFCIGMSLRGRFMHLFDRLFCQLLCHMPTVPSPKNRSFFFIFFRDVMGSHGFSRRRGSQQHLDVELPGFIQPRQRYGLSQLPLRAAALNGQVMNHPPCSFIAASDVFSLPVPRPATNRFRCVASSGHTGGVPRPL